MDKVTCIAYILYQSSQNLEVKEIAIGLLNGDVSLHELRKNRTLHPQLVLAESLFKKNKIDKRKIQLFAEEFLLVEA